MDARIPRRTALVMALATAASARAQTSSSKPAPPDLESRLAGKIFLKGDDKYEALRQAATWNARKPNRFPTAIVLPRDETDVVAAVKLAKARGWQVTSRSGGHSFTGSHTRDGALQVNLAQMKELSVDPRRRIATLTPSWKGGAFNNVLRDEHRLMFPIAHGFDIGIGGFVMCGGHGWNSRTFGLGCENLRALDVVTADGELIHADETRNSDYLWAARGSGPGFFGVAVRYYLDVHPQPEQVNLSRLVFPLSMADEVTAWLDGVDFPKFMEPALIYLVHDGKPALQLMIATFARSGQEADAGAKIVAACPIAHKAVDKALNTPAHIPSRSEAEDAYQGPMGGRYTVDGAFTNAPLREAFALLREELETPPVPGVTISVSSQQPSGKIKNMAYSITGRFYFSAMTISYDPAEDAACAAWLARVVEKLRPIATGSQMNDENMPINTLPYLSAEASARLEALRAKHDPERRFPSFLS
jgi:FAD/FMN-containing dehydrogenase